MKIAVILVACALASGCLTGRKSAATVLRQADRTLGDSARDALSFEGRLHELGAIIELGATPGERTALVPVPGKPGYFPPRILKVVYVLHDHGRVEVKSAELKSLGSGFAGTTAR
ncbi:MAG TPA: hypothetical protein VM029_11740 [Opitutaceae bacterium]|nr:hypothetical protein [Opitutaceae bacterium]